jgi:hypothetical protein
MLQMPLLELRIRDFGQQLHAVSALQQEEIEQYVQASV